jgi:hypothetical protein
LSNLSQREVQVSADEFLTVEFGEDFAVRVGKDLVRLLGR